MAGADLTLYGDGSYIRDDVYIDDVVRAFLIAGVRPEMSGGVFNVAKGIGHTVRKAFEVVAARVEQATGTRARFQNAPWPRDPDPIELRSFVADMTRFGETCKWTPGVTLADGVDRLVTSVVATGRFSQTAGRQTVPPGA